MSPETPNNSEMVDLAKPARLRHVVIITASAPFIGVLIWVAPEFAKESDLTSLIGIMPLLLCGVFPFARGIHALFARPYLRANQTDIAIRHWGGGGSWFLPFHRVRNDSLRWNAVRGVSQQRITHYGIVVEDYAIIECADMGPVHIHRGVFNLSVDAILNIIQNRIAADESRSILPSGRSRPYVLRLERHFAQMLALRYSASLSRLAGLIIGPPVGFVGWQWIIVHIGEQPKLDIALAVGSCMAIAWLVYAVDEAVRCFRFHGKNFWFRGDGLAAGPNEFSAKLYGWREIVGARRRIKNILDQWGRSKESKLDGMDVLLRDGGTVWIPEQYSDRLDELCEVLSPEDEDAIPLLDTEDRC